MRGSRMSACGYYLPLIARWCACSVAGVGFSNLEVPLTAAGKVEISCTSQMTHWMIHLKRVEFRTCVWIFRNKICAWKSRDCEKQQCPSQCPLHYQTLATGHWNGYPMLQTSSDSEKRKACFCRCSFAIFCSGFGHLIIDAELQTIAARFQIQANAFFLEKERITLQKKEKKKDQANAFFFILGSLANVYSWLKESSLPKKKSCSISNLV